MDNTWIVGVTLLAIVFTLILIFVYAIAFLFACDYAKKLPKEEQEKFWRDYNMNLLKNDHNFFL